MIEEQKLINIEVKELQERVKEFYGQGFRLVQICCTKLAEGLELNYSFDKNFEFINLRINLAVANVEVPSVSNIYWNAFLYENELHDLFGINIKNMAIDYKGSFYRTAVKWPFNPPLDTAKGEGKND